MTSLTFSPAPAVLRWDLAARVALALAWLVGRRWVRTPPGGPGAEDGGPT